MGKGDQAFVGAIPAVYDHCLGPMLFEPYALDLADRLTGFDGAILETAAGTGRVTRALLRVVGPNTVITATDLNEPMLACAAELIHAPNVEWRQADAQALPFDDARFDAVVCQFGVMFFPDKAAGYAEAHRVLKPHGCFLFNVWDSLDVNDISKIVHDTVVSLFPDDPPDFLARVPFGYHGEGPIRDALRTAGFTEVKIERVALTTPAHSALDAATGLCLGSPLRSELEARAPDRLDAIVGAAAQALARRFGTGPIAGKGQALVVTAVR